MHIGGLNMNTIENQPTSFISPALDEFVTTTADTESPINRKRSVGDDGDERWQNLINQLIEWGCDGDPLSDDGNDPPSREIVQLAARFALALRDDGLRCPDNLVADPNGGVVFEY